MVELMLGPRSINLPYTVRISGVTEEMFDELTDEDTRAELIDGVMIVHSPASPAHEDIGGFLRGLMRCYAKKKVLGMVTGPDALFRPGEGRRFGPDMFFIRADRAPRPRPKKFYSMTPDLVVEVLSPFHRDEDLEVKRPAYREAKIPELWFVDPQEGCVIQDRLGRRRYSTTTITSGRVTSVILPGFWVELNWLWADPMPDDLDCLLAILGES